MRDKDVEILSFTPISDYAAHFWRKDGTVLSVPIVGLARVRRTNPSSGSRGVRVEPLAIQDGRVEPCEDNDTYLGITHGSDSDPTESMVKSAGDLRDRPRRMQAGRDRHRSATRHEGRGRGDRSAAPRAHRRGRRLHHERRHGR